MSRRDGGASIFFVKS